MITLRNYQQELVDKIHNSNSIRNCIQSPTGSGKTVVFSYLANENKGNVLILVNRMELLEQTDKFLNGIPNRITAGNKLTNHSNITIAMVETFNNKIKKGLIDINNYDLIIADEVQNTQFVKVFKDYKGRLLGFTATPVIDKRDHYHKCKVCNTRYNKKTDCCGRTTKEFSSAITLKKWYGDLITGTSIERLIEIGKLTPVHNFVCDTPNLDKLKTDRNGQFTSDSESEVFDNYSSLENLILNYETHCKGLKTMVFNSTIKSNELAYNEFLKRGYNVRSYDSTSTEDRKELVKWFENTKDSVLMSVGVFTTGFDVDDVEAIIMNRATKSLSLYHQIVGRGGRTTNKIFKPYFKLIDLGGNVNRFGSWSENVNWQNIYNHEDEKEKRPKLEEFLVCKNCGAMVKKMPCDYCGHIEEKKEAVTKNVDQVIAKEVKRIPKPSASRILNFAEAQGLDVNQAKNITADYIVDMFKSANTSRETAMINNDYLSREITKMITPIYFTLHNSKLKGNRKRTINDFFNKVNDRLKKYYDEK